MPILPREDNQTGTNRLEDLATMFLSAQRPPQDTGPKFITAGNRVMGMDVSQPSGADKMGGMLNNLATNFLMAQEMKKRNQMLQQKGQFFQSVNNIMGSNSPSEDTTDDKGVLKPGKKSQLRQLITQHGGQDYDLGIKESLWKDFREEKTQPIVDAQGNIVGHRPKGSVFQSSASKKKEDKLILKKPLRRVGALDPRRILPGSAAFNDFTQKVIRNIKTEEDIKELLRDRELYEEQGVDVQSIIDYYTS